MRPGIIALVLAAACGSPDPSDPSDPAELDAAQVLGHLVALTDVNSGDYSMNEDLRAAGMMLDRIFTSPGLPDSVKGGTYVMEQDAGGHRYVASGRPGAPAPGARFVLYQSTFPIYSETPIAFPYVEMGHLDLETDIGASSRRISVTAASGERLAVYSVIATTSPDSQTVELSAFRDNGSDRIEFDLRSMTLTGEGLTGEGPGANRRGTLVFPGLDLRIVSQATRDQHPNLGLTFTVSVDARGGRFRIDGRHAFNVITATVTVNGVEHATMASREGSPIIVTPVGDRVLTADEESLFELSLRLAGSPVPNANALINPISRLIAPVPWIP